MSGMIAETEGIQRVRYVERGPLSAADLVAEQSARLSGRWLHQIAEHDWGIVVGLALDLGQRGLTVQPGVAVDGYGRELVLGEPLRLEWGGWKDETGMEVDLFTLLGSQPDHNHNDIRAADLWLLWDRRPEYPPAAGRSPAGPGQNSRWLEIPRLRVLAAEPKAAPMNQPAADPNAPLELDPRTPPGIDADTQTLLPAYVTDDPALEWPVYLGRVTHDAQADPGNPYAVDASIPRPYARLRGETVTAASRLAQMQLSGGPGRSRFVVALPDASAASEKGVTFGVEPLAINEPGELVTRGETQLYGFAYKYPDGVQKIDKQGDLVIENRPAFDAKDVGSVTTLVQMLTNKDNPAAQEIYKKLDVTTRESLQAINLGERLVGVNLRKLIATDLSTIVNEGLPVSIFNNLQLDRIGGLPGGMVSPVFPRGLPFVPRSTNIPLRRPMTIRRNLLPGRAEAVNFGAGQNAAGENAEGNLSREELRALFEALFPGLLTDTGGQDWGVTIRPLARLPAEAAPWQVYHAVVKPEEPPQGGAAAPEDAAAKQSAKDIHQLRIEIQNPGDTGDPRLHRFVIGKRVAEVEDEADEAPADGVVVEPAVTENTQIPFTECLIVQADGTVAMLGDIIRVNGQVLEGPVQANPDDPRLAAALVGASARFAPSSTALKVDITLPSGEKKVIYTITNTTSSQFICSPLYERIYQLDSQGQAGNPVRQGSIGGQLAIMPNNSITVEASTEDLPKDQNLRYSIRVIGADQNGNYALTDFSIDVTIT